MTALDGSNSKSISLIFSRVLAGLIDAFFVAVIDCSLMYVFWLLGMLCGSLDAAPEHWQQILYSVPLFLLDGISVLVFPFSLWYFNYSGGLSEQTSSIANSFLFVVVMVNWLYHALFEASREHATPGKQLMDLEVVSTEDETVDFITASIRHFGKIAAFLPFGIAALPLFGAAKARSFHDLIAKTDVRQIEN